LQAHFIVLIEKAAGGGKRESPYVEKKGEVL